MHKWKDYSTKDLTNGSLGLFTTLTLNQTPVLTAYRTFLVCACVSQAGFSFVCYTRSQEKNTNNNNNKNETACSTSLLIPHSLSSAYNKPYKVLVLISLTFNSLYSFIWYILSPYIFILLLKQVTSKFLGSHPVTHRMSKLIQFVRLSSDVLSNFSF